MGTIGAKELNDSLKDSVSETIPRAAHDKIVQSLSEEIDAWKINFDNMKNENIRVRQINSELNKGNSNLSQKAKANLEKYRKIKRAITLIANGDIDNITFTE